MTALVRLPHRLSVRAVLMVPVGLGWQVGVGHIATGRIEGEHTAFMNEGKAEQAAIDLGDVHDLIALRCEAACPTDHRSDLATIGRRRQTSADSADARPAQSLGGRI